ncbi:MULTISPECIES: FtsX-like permease family protein [Paenibacillus]|uniref:FtsX-like permease family protein n=1 Tax=Paenibacillus TaxID=44249 RepID=UPI00073F64C9|nr:MULTISPECIES: ABC transporter permease [Paenibacillus]MDU4694783.1 ABC transporter permease [Paenibacillus sp.]
MIRLKAAVRALRNRWFLSLLLLIQFTYGLSTVTSSGNIFYNFYYLLHDSLLDLDSTYLVVPGKNFGIAESERSKYDKEQIEALYRKLDQSPDVLAYGTYYESIVLLDDQSSLIDTRLLEGMSKRNSGLDDPYIQSIVIDKNYYSLMDLRLGEGQGLLPQDFERTGQQQVNVLVGSYFKKYYKIGDLINDQYRINGFLPDRYIVNNNTTNVYLNLDKAMLIPMPIDQYSEFDYMYSRLFLGTVLKLREDANLDQLIEILRLPNSKIDISLHSLEEDVRTNIRSSIYAQIPQLILAGCFILFSVISIALATIISILIRKREFGIKLAVGESVRGIWGQIVLENTIIALVGTGLSLFYFVLKFQRLLQRSSQYDMASVLSFRFNAPIFLLIFIVLMIIIVISSFVIYPFIRKQEIKSLIGGME